MTDAIAFKYRAEAPWMDLPEHLGSRKGAHNRLRAWVADGTWEKTFTALLAQADAEDDLDWVVAVDSTVVRAHRHSARACQKCPGGVPVSADDYALGRSGSGPTAKMHLAADSRCCPLAFVIMPDQAGDTPAYFEVMARLRVPRPIGWPRTAPDMIPADQACPSRPSRTIRTHLRRRGIRVVISQPAGQAANRKRRGRLGGRPQASDGGAHEQRNTVERYINKFEQGCGPTIRYDKTTTIHLAGLHLAAIFIWSAR